MMAKNTICNKVIDSLNLHVSNNAALKHIKKNFRNKRKIKEMLDFSIFFNF